MNAVLHSANTLINLSETRKKYQHNDNSVRATMRHKILDVWYSQKRLHEKSGLCYRIVDLNALK